MINRAKMPRQLRNKGGITNVVPRTNYLLGGIKDRIRKLIPNELASVASKAAPFVAPFNPAIAGLMRGIGRFDQRGSLSDAFKQGIGTFAGGQLLRTIGGAGPQRGFGTPGDRFTSPLSADRTTAVRDFFSPKEDTKFIEKVTGDAKKTEKGLKSIRDATGLFKDTPILKDLPSIVQQQILVGGASGALTYIYQAFLAEEPPQEEGETYDQYIARRRENVGRKMKGYFDNYFKFDKEYSSMTDEQKQAFIDRVNIANGGRIGFDVGGSVIGKVANFFFDEEGNASKALQRAKFEISKFISGMGTDLETGAEWYNKLEPEEQREIIEEKMKYREKGELGGVPVYDEKYAGKFGIGGNYADGGRIEFRVGGGMPTGIMRTNKAGVMERDYRDKGGFVPVGIKEKADDVPAMLSKNEFVFTADAVRGAGNGSIEKGAQRMYDTMKKLEKRVV